MLQPLLHWMIPCGISMSYTVDVYKRQLQAGVPVKKGMKIGDVDPRKDGSLVYLISDKSHKIGRGCVETIRTLSLIHILERRKLFL